MKRLLSIILTLSLFCNNVFALDSINSLYETKIVQDNVLQLLSEENCQITTTNLYEWDDCYGITIVAKNTGNVNARNWELSFGLLGSIKYIENAQIKRISKNHVTLIGKAETEVIRPNQEIRIPIVVNGNMEDNPITDISVKAMFDNIKSCEIDLVSAKSYQRVNNSAMLLYDVTTSITGTFKDINNVEKAIYRIINENGEILCEGAVELSDHNEWSIHDIGFDIGLNRIDIIASSSNMVFEGDIYIINMNSKNAENVGIDVKTDTDLDGIRDYRENKMGLDPYTPECKSNYSDLSDKASDIDSENNVAYDNNIILNSNTSAIIHRTFKPKGQKDNWDANTSTVAEDLTFNDYTFTELCELGSEFYVMSERSQQQMFANMSLLFDIESIVADSSMKNALEEMLALFASGDHIDSAVYATHNYNSSLYDVYYDSAIDNEVINDNSTENYVALIDSFVESQLSQRKTIADLTYTIGNDDNLIEDYVLSIYPTPYPSYGATSPLGIAIHAWHGHDITIMNYYETTTGYSANLSYHFYDHFGLDTNDKGIFNNTESFQLGFIDWFTLQHYREFNGKYAPFIVTSTFATSINGIFD